MSFIAKSLQGQLIATNFMASLVNQADGLSNNASAAYGCFANMLDLAIDQLEKNGGNWRAVNKQRLAVIVVAKLGPAGGALNNDFINFAIALSSLGFSGTGAASAAAAILAEATVATAGGLALAALAIGCDAFMLGVMLAKIMPDGYQARIDHNKLMRLRAEFERQAASRPSGRQHVYH